MERWAVVAGGRILPLGRSYLVGRLPRDLGGPGVGRNYCTFYIFFSFMIFFYVETISVSLALPNC